MKLLPILFFVVMCASSCATKEERWKTVDEGFRLTIPASWKKQKVQPYDSNCGTYKARTTDLEFDEVYGLGYTAKKSQVLIDQIRKKESDAKLLEPGEEVWHVDGRIALFWAGIADPKIYGKRRFSKVADLHVPYAAKPGYLSIYIFYKSDRDQPTVRRVLQSIKWEKESPEK